MIRDINFHGADLIDSRGFSMTHEPDWKFCASRSNFIYDPQGRKT